MSNNGEDRRMPPMDGQVAAANVDGTATGAAVIANKPTGPGGYMTFENQGTTDINIVFGTSASMGAPTVSTNSGRIGAGQARDWYVGADVTHWRAIGSAAGGKLVYWKSSP
jgi:hypothetical protein